MIDSNLFTLLMKQHDEIKADIKEVRSDIEALKVFKWKIVGACSAVFFVLEVAFRMAEAALSHS